MQLPGKILKKGPGWVKLAINTKVYPLTTVYSAGYIFLDRAYIYIDKEKKDRVTVWLFSKNKKEPFDNLGMEFCNELLNYAHYFTSLEANADAVKVLMQRALFSAAPSIANEAATNEIEQLMGSLVEKKNKR